MRIPLSYRPYVRAFRRLVIGTVFLVAATGLVFGGTSLARPVLLGLTALWWAMQFIVARRARSGTLQPVSRISRLGDGLEIVAGNIALTAVLAELALRAFALTAGAAPVVSDALQAYRLAPYRDYGAGLRGNRLGYPGPDWSIAKLPGQCRIAALGDSFAVGPAVAYEANYLTLIGQNLGAVELLNFGVAGTGPREYALILRQDVWQYQPKFVLVSVFVGNDITEELATPHKMDPRESYLYLLVTRGGRLLREAYRLKAVKSGETGDRLSAGQMSPARFLEVEQRRLAICCRSAVSDLEKKWQRALSRLDRIVVDCQKRHVPVAFVLIPDEFQVNPGLLQEVLGAGGPAAADIDLALPQRRLTAFFAERAVPCLDLMPVFAGTTDNYAPRDTHWNEHGNRRAAAAIEPWLRDLLPVSQSVSVLRPTVP
jgi:hypothetical protein